MYSLRVRVPDDLKARVGLLEVRRSLKTHSPSVARQLALKHSARVLEIFDMARAKPIARDVVRQMICASFADLSASADRGFVPRSSMPDLEIAEQRGNALERIATLRDEVGWGAFGEDVRCYAEAMARQNGIGFGEQPLSTQHDLMSGAARAIIEQQRLFLFRLQDRLGPYVPCDDLFRTPLPAIAATVASPTVDRELQVLVERYLAQGAKAWTSKTVAMRKRQLGHLVEHFGSTTDALSISQAGMRDYRDAICRLRANYKQCSAKTFVGRQTADPSKQIAPKTASLFVEAAKAFFRWAEAEADISPNPAKDLRLTVAKKAKTKPRRPFTTDELKVIFSAPLYTGSKSQTYRFEAGPRVFSDARYWIPLIGYFTGMRLGEIVQLHFGDVHLDGPIPFLDVTEESDEAPGSGDAKHVKSVAGIRKVPLHPDLMTLGFMKFVEGRRKRRKGSGRLFFEVKYGAADKMPSGPFSKWFARFLDKLGVTDKAVVFHSFRHNAKDALRNAGQQPYVIDRIIGHAEVASAHYGDGASLETCYDAVCAMKFKVAVLELVQPPNQ